MDLGDKIKAARAQKGLTQRELAQRAKLTERTIQRIENHEVEPSVYSLNKISENLEFEFLTEKPRIIKRRKQIIYTLMAVWTAALVFNLIFTDFTFADRWWEILMWGMTLSAVVTGQIYIPYRSKK